MIVFVALKTKVHDAYQKHNSLETGKEMVDSLYISVFVPDAGRYEVLVLLFILLLSSFVSLLNTKKDITEHCSPCKTLCCL